MTKQEYQKRLEAIFDDLPSDPQITFEAKETFIQAICLLNEEAIGAETYPMKLVTDELLESGHSHYTDIIIAKGYAQNELRQELKAVIGTSNE